MGDEQLYVESTCPKCGSPDLNRANQYGFVLCNKCGWIQSNQLAPRSLRAQVMVFLRWLGLGFSLLFLVYLTVQMFLWKEYTFEASMLQLRSLFVSDNLKDKLEIGAICNSLEKYDCSISVFKEIVESDPNNKKALANLAIALAKTEKWKSARPHFEAYFSLGGGGYDVVLWYGQVLAKLEGVESGIPWFYLALAMQPDYSEAASVLVAALTSKGRLHEALSVIGGFTGGHHEQYRVWRDRVENLWSQVNASREASKKQGVNLPGLSGTQPLLAGQLKKGGRLRYFFVDPRFKWLTVDQGIMDENLISIPEEAEDIEIKTLNGTKPAKKFKLEWVQLGPWDFSNVDVVVCEKCPPVMGLSLLSKLSHSTWTKNRIEFITLASKGVNL